MPRLVRPMRYLVPMSPVWSLATLAGVHLLAAVSPGPAVLSTIQVSVGGSRKRILLHVVGLGLAVATWAAATMLGLEALMQRVSFLFRLLQALGGLYLVYVGIQSWRHAQDPLAGVNLNDTAGRSDSGSILQGLRRGYLTNISNPKVMVFFASIFSAVLAPHIPVWARVTAIVIVFLNETGWNAALGLLLSTRKAQMTYLHWKAAIDRTAGLFMGAFGLRLLWGARKAA